MRILFLSMHYKPEPCDTRTSVLAREFVRRGHDAVALTSFPNYPYGRVYDGYKQSVRQEETIDGVRVVRVPMVPDHSRSIKKRALSYLSFGASAALFGSLFVRRADVVWIHHPPLTTGIAGYLLAKVMRAPYVYEVHDLWPESLMSTGMVKESRITKVIRKVCSFLYSRATAVVVTSEGMKRHLVSQGVPYKKIHVIHQWADEDALAPAPKDAAFGRQNGMEGKFNVVFTGNIGTAQALDSVIEAAEQLLDLEDVQFVLVGEGVELEDLKSRAPRNVVFTGQVEKPAVRKYLAWADALLVTLKDDPLFRITVPSKTQTYMLAGRPLICGVAGDTERIVTDAECGLCYPPEQPGALAYAVRLLHSTPVEEREDMGMNGQAAYDEAFSIEASSDLYEALFHGVLQMHYTGVDEDMVDFRRAA